MHRKCLDDSQTCLTGHALGVKGTSPGLRLRPGQSDVPRRIVPGRRRRGRWPPLAAGRGSHSAQRLLLGAGPREFLFFLGSDSERFTFLFSVLEARHFQHRQLSELCGGEDGLARGGR